MSNFLLRLIGALLLLPAFPFALAQQSSMHQTHHYDLADPALSSAAQRYDWAQEGKGNRAELERLVADDYVLVRASGKVTNKAGLIELVCHPGSYTNPYTVETPFVRDLGSTVILGGWVDLSGTDNGKPFDQKVVSQSGCYLLGAMQLPQIFALGVRSGLPQLLQEGPYSERR